VAGLWFSPGTPVSSTNKTDRHDITEILLKVVLNTITPHMLVSPKVFISVGLNNENKRHKKKTHQ